MFSTLRRSARLFGAHPWLALGLGIAIVLSLCAMCTGIGFLTAPWYVCEMLGVQLTTEGRTVAPRGRTWLSASAVVFVMIVIAAAAGWLAVLGFGPDRWDQSDLPLPWPETLLRVAQVVGSCALAVLFIAPFVHAPLILLDRGGRIGGAMMESAMLVRTTGLGRHLLMAALAQVLALAPAVVAAMFVARTFARAATPLGLLAALPVMPISIALGLGLVSLTYVDTEASLGDARRAQRQGALPRLHRWVLGTLITAPIVGLLFLGASAFRPAPPALLLAEPAGEPVVTCSPSTECAIPETGLVLGVTEHDVSIGHDPDSQGIPRAWRGTIDAVHVHRTGYLEHLIAIHTTEGAWYVRVDPAGERTDDSVRRSLLSHGWVLATFVGSAAVVALFSIYAFAPLGAARARAARVPGARTVDADARRESFRVALALLPFALSSLASGALALLGA